METRMKHNESKSGHKYSGLGRITSTLGVFAATALICVSLVSGTARGADGSDIIDKLNGLISDVIIFRDTTLPILAGNVGNSTSSGITDAKNAILGEVGSSTAAILANTDAAETSIHDSLFSTHLVKPLDVAVNICTEIEGGGSIEGGAEIGIGANLEAHLGIDFYGSGAQIGIKPQGNVGAGLFLRSDVETYVVACINGVFARQNQDLLEEAAIKAAAPVAYQNFVDELIDTGRHYRDRIRGTAETINLVDVDTTEGAYVQGGIDNGSDRLNTSLDGFEGITTLNAALLGNFITNSTSGLDGLVGGLSSAGNWMDQSANGGLLSDVTGTLDLSSSDVTSIGSTISSGLTTFGLNLQGGFTDLTSTISTAGNALTSFKDMEAVITCITTTIGNILDPNVTVNCPP